MSIITREQHNAEINKIDPGFFEKVSEFLKSQKQSKHPEKQIFQKESQCGA